ncbi:MAG: hypothetical protein M1821_005421 [Bathelium mastoideum]|nr:MAG: hypothetical protein M1821_005421 [Bathelium mastoideum]
MPAVRDHDHYYYYDAGSPAPRGGGRGPPSRPPPALRAPSAPLRSVTGVVLALVGPGGQALDLPPGCWAVAWRCALPPHIAALLAAAAAAAPAPAPALTPSPSLTPALTTPAPDTPEEGADGVGMKEEEDDG